MKQNDQPSPNPVPIKTMETQHALNHQPATAGVFGGIYDGQVARDLYADNE